MNVLRNRNAARVPSTFLDGIGRDVLRRSEARALRKAAQMCGFALDAEPSMPTYNSGERLACAVLETEIAFTSSVAVEVESVAVAVRSAYLSRVRNLAAACAARKDAEAAAWCDVLLAHGGFIRHLA